MKEKKIAILGLGYVGLPLALQLSLSYNVIGYDVDNIRIKELRKGIDKTLEVSESLLKKQQKSNLFFSDNFKDISNCNFYIATVPTPIDEKKKPDFFALKKVCETIGKLLSYGDTVVFESTVYPGATEEICAPILEKFSKNLRSGKDFFLGYSPERVNPGDKVHTIDKINKVVSGQTQKVEKDLLEIYSNLTNGEVYLAKSIKVAEASKVIENAQRDINIAFINEVAKICTKINISSYDVLEASLTKWNFLNFEPGLVGGHCIGVDPYYLAEKAKNLNVSPEVILSGRNTNDNMVKFIGMEIVKRLPSNSSCLFLGVTFKENVPDLRNSKSLELMNYLEKKNLKITYYDPFINKLKDFKGLRNKNLTKKKFDGIVLSVPHKKILLNFEQNFLSLLKKEGVLFDVKGKFRNKKITNYWSL
ncbi:MAG: UDP-N-acetyl-D-galactosamine dehydrogenase [Rickettsiales bacterium]|nr:UDP-N-acetyl-D-galactosamine dehydrogenase [Rickettsiales bacterium]|tara:strand:+ start:77 stop:1333 length:1257 start_codon:yes stop_codon:yes gene_type:complete